MSGKKLRAGAVTAVYARKKRRYERARRRRRAMFFIGLVVFILVMTPFLLRLPETIQKVTHPLRYEAQIRQASQQSGLEPAFIAGVVYTESRFRPDAESHQGAYGLMQLLPVTANFVQQRSGIQGDYRNPGVNLRLGAWYLGYLEDRYEGHERLMLAAYNSGESRVDGWVSQEGFDIERDIPFQETREYVDDVLEAREVYRDLYGEDLSGD
ncbi:MAG TPA: lytic transglycosylase domain-containing protein [Rubrobacteraceae bacterium]|nr:lytic transglycosylase domain-containing protein [Rubrobacteraceae bacterium]